MIVEKHVRYATEVETVQDAFKFIMSYLDEIQTPHIEIRPFYIVQDDDHPAGIMYEVSIGGDV